MAPNANEKKANADAIVRKVLNEEEEKRVIEKVRAKAKRQAARDDELSPELRNACWYINMFYVIFLGFFCYLDPSAENVQRFFAFTVLGALIYIRYVLLSD